VTTLHFKFCNDASSDDREGLIAKLERSGVEQVTPLFPGASDEELATLYSAVVRDDRDFGDVLRMLNSWQKVEFAEPAAERRLILPE
jgi:hypothetical protein